jgi:MinD superfamily P-loop ATPase
MKSISITGGKGGTGKSTIAILFANKLVREGKRVVLADCDVECPNDHLLLGQKLKKPRERVYNEFPVLIKSKCRKCGLCVKTCRNNAIFQAPGQYPVFIKDLCSGCGACWIVCPYKAIKSQKEETGQIYLNKIQDTKYKIQDYWLVTGVAKAKLEETGPIVLKTKEFAFKIAKKVKADYVLFDTAAGTHCPVISALLGCDSAYAVTEPTPMGAYDLNLILDLCQKLKVKTKVIINQSDLGSKKTIKKIARKYKSEIKKEISYSKELVEAYSKGQLLNFKSKSRR